MYGAHMHHIKIIFAYIFFNKYLRTLEIKTPIYSLFYFLSIIILYEKYSVYFLRP